VLGINADPVSIKLVEWQIVDHAWERGWIRPVRPTVSTGRSVAVVGSGPAGLAAAQQLTRAGHRVTVYERDDRVGGLLRYGIPEFKLEKRFLDRRLAQMEAEGTTFRTGVHVGVDVDGDTLAAEHDAVVLAGGATVRRDLPIPGRELAGVHQAMEYLPLANRVQLGDLDESPITAAGKHVVVIGGGDTGADCIGTAHRQGALSVTSFEIMPRPPDARPDANPWPTWPVIYRTASAHEEGGDRIYAINTECFLADDDGGVRALRAHRVEQRFVDGRMVFEKVDDSDEEFECQLVLLAMGFVGPETEGIVAQLGVETDARGNVARGDDYATNVAGVFCCGDMGRGQSLIVWAIAEGRSCAASVDAFLVGETLLPAPIAATQRPLA
jgi:glutamate synthase (NADPH/NADH) small chain